MWSVSSVGRAPARHAGGHRFKSYTDHFSSFLILSNGKNSEYANGDLEACNPTIEEMAKGEELPISYFSGV